MNNQIMYWNRKTQAEASDTQITPHFTMAEHQCKCGDCIVQRVHIDLYPMLEELRGALGARPIRITSGYRCNAHNEAVGGMRLSKHLGGRAVDCVAAGYDVREVAKIGRSIGFKGIGVYHSWVHFDIRTSEASWGPLAI